MANQKIDYPRVVAQLQQQRNAAFDAHAVANARAEELADQLRIAEAAVEELTAKLNDAAPAPKKKS